MREEGVDARRAAIRALAALHEARPLDESLDDIPLAARERALAQWLAYGAARFLPQLEYLAGALLSRPFRRRDRDLQALLHLALFELRQGRRPPFAVVNEWVAMTEVLGKGWGKGVVNAVLRAFTADRERWEGQLAASDLRFAHPAWLLARLREAWPGHWQEMVAANNAEAPLWLRVNVRRITPPEYQRQLSAAGMEAQGVRWSDTALRLDAAVPVGALPGWDEGWVSVQDGAAQKAAWILDPPSGSRVLDACAAPGGKTAHLLERQDLDLLALDRSPRRIGKMAVGLERLGLKADLRVGDGARPADWWDGRPFDAILLDAPCTGTGVIRRHPDIKALRHPEDVAQAVAGQQALLEALWPCLRRGGRLLYATCSVLPEENADQIAAFLARHTDARHRPHPLAGQSLPGEGGMDGFYYALLEKAP